MTHDHHKGPRNGHRADDLRPDHLPVRVDAIHRFFKDWQRIGDPHAESWQTWFTSTGVRFERRGVGERFMLYTHRSHQGHMSAASRWCCT